MTVPSTYIGRFAPSPSGPLHFGSLVTAVGSFLDARANAGQWLVRMEDLDPPREQPGASDHILRTLEAFGLTWDGPVMFQSARDEAYELALQQLDDRVFYCTCTRADLRPHQGIYPGTCYAQRTPPKHAASSIRLRGPNEQPPSFTDIEHGPVQLTRAQTGTDPVLKRKDDLWAYLLAVVTDDAAQGVTRVVRGHDLFTATPLQVLLQQMLGLATPEYLHLPVVNAADGRKLSKQNRAPAVEPNEKNPLLRQALQALGLSCPTDADPLTWGVEHWLERSGGMAAVIMDDLTRPGPSC